jgi:hypothetical protein
VTPAALKTVTQKYPWMTVKHVGSKDDQAISRAINGGHPRRRGHLLHPGQRRPVLRHRRLAGPDPYLASSKVDKAQVWPAGVFSYTSSRTSSAPCRC